MIGQVLQNGDGAVAAAVVDVHELHVVAERKELLSDPLNRGVEARDDGFLVVAGHDD